ncbi:uncharacterized protein KY384_006209 [Bacidia gigantensis]|uniref:uncharacterized protein n=1 Tax=Bacidia gigantensis TaxID=2732470 RepID=UPI001D0531F4|nr:uncharacterized protein KY384_006209 [Bacidia gigantensis]KAG8529572.1 hypothetical protein KY384_006209 [Bacidia gigantensis]
MYGTPNAVNFPSSEIYLTNDPAFYQEPGFIQQPFNGMGDSFISSVDRIPFPTYTDDAILERGQGGLYESDRAHESSGTNAHMYSNAPGIYDTFQEPRAQASSFSNELMQTRANGTAGYQLREIDIDSANPTIFDSQSFTVPENLSASSIRQIRPYFIPNCPLGQSATLDTDFQTDNQTQQSIYTTSPYPEGGDFNDADPLSSVVMTTTGWYNGQAPLNFESRSQSRNLDGDFTPNQPPYPRPVTSNCETSYDREKSLNALHNLQSVSATKKLQNEESTGSRDDSSSWHQGPRKPRRRPTQPSVRRQYPPAEKEEVAMKRIVGVCEKHRIAKAKCDCLSLETLQERFRELQGNVSSEPY